MVGPIGDIAKRSNDRLMTQKALNNMIREKQLEEDYDAICGPGSYRKMKQAKKDGAIIVTWEKDAE